jgi:hypothetical protein
MAKKNIFYGYIIAGLLIFLGLSLIIQYFNINLLEGLDGNKDEFSIALNVKLTGKNGNLVPHPLGSYNVKTISGSKVSTYDFSMNEVLKINTTLEKDSSDKVFNRTIEIIPINTNSITATETVRDVIPNHFALDISFNQVGYILDKVADLKAAVELRAIGSEKDRSKSNDMSIPQLNILTDNGILLIKGMGAIYRINEPSNPIGGVQTDMNNEKAFKITINIPTDPNNLLKAYVNAILITFKYPVPSASMTNMPIPPAPLSQSTIDNIPRP